MGKWKYPERTFFTDSMTEKMSSASLKRTRAKDTKHRTWGSIDTGTRGV